MLIFKKGEYCQNIFLCVMISFLKPTRKVPCTVCHLVTSPCYGLLENKNIEQQHYHILRLLFELLELLQGARTIIYQISPFLDCFLDSQRTRTSSRTFGIFQSMVFELLGSQNDYPHKYHLAQTAFWTSAKLEQGAGDYGSFLSQLFELLGKWSNYPHKYHFVQITFWTARKLELGEALMVPF